MRGDLTPVGLSATAKETTKSNKSYNSRTQTFRNFRSHLKIQNIRRVTLSKFDIGSQSTKILPTVTWNSEFVHPWITITSFCTAVINNAWYWSVFNNVNTSVEITTKFDILDFKLAPYCEFSVISFGLFPGVWIFCADVSEHPVPPIFIGRFLFKRRWNRKSVPKRRHRKFRRRGITQQKEY